VKAYSHFTRTLSSLGIKLFLVLFALIFAFSLVGIQPARPVAAIAYARVAYNDSSFQFHRQSVFMLEEEVAIATPAINTSTVITPPGAFSKTSPANAATDVAINPTLSWEASSGATSYRYCYATTWGCIPSIFTSTTSATLSGLSNNQMYYWQVRAINTKGSTYANAGTYWSFTTVVAPPGAFNKTSPANAATSVATTPTLSWGTSSGAAKYEYCYATTSGCTSWISAGMSTSAALSGLSNEQIYYWQVRAVNAGGSVLANTGTYWYFTTEVKPPSFPLFLPIISR
jgi:hypothetical protein